MEGAAGTRWFAEVGAWAAQWGRSPLDAVLAQARRTAALEGWPADALAETLGETWSAPDLADVSFPTPPPSVALGPNLLGPLYETLLAAPDRRRRGAHFTPPQVAARLAEIALDRCELANPTVGDPSVGGGAFLLAAAAALVARGRDAEAVLREDLWGLDVDPAALAVSRLALSWWGWLALGRPAGRWPQPAGLAVADALIDAAAWPAEGAQVVVGNPPFLGQLAAATARTPNQTAELVAALGPVASGYVDTAALFLVAACRRTVAGGVVALVQPESFLAAAHVGPARRAVLETGSLGGLWLGGARVFAASVRVCAPVVRIAARPGSAVGAAAGPASGHDRPVALWRGVELATAGTGEPPAAADISWAPLLACADGVPAPDGVATVGRVGDLATATAGFRDQFYGVLPHLMEGEANDGAPLVTSGLIGSGRSFWSLVPATVGRRRWAAPAVDLAALRAADPTLGRWVDARLRPKLVLATQTPVVEAAVDELGAWIPATPVVSVEPHDPEDLWRLAAVLNSPFAAAWARYHHGGTGLSGNAVRLAARQVLDLPLPAPGPALDRAAAAVRRAALAPDEPSWRDALDEAAAASCEAYDVDPGRFVPWWAARVAAWPRRRSAFRNGQRG